MTKLPIYFYNKFIQNDLTNIIVKKLLKFILPIICTRPLIYSILFYRNRDRTPSDRTPWRLNAVETERRGDHMPSDRMPRDRMPSETECQVRLNAKQTECQGDMNAKYTYIMLWNKFWFSILTFTSYFQLVIK